MLKYLEWLRVRKNSLQFSKTIDKTILDKAERLLIKKAQWERFGQEITNLTQKNPVNNNSAIRGLNPVLDENGLLRSKGRLENVKFLQYDTKTPIILPKGHHITSLILSNYHQRYFHKKTESVLAAVRQRFWVVDLRATLKRVVNNCQYCKNMLAKPNPQ